MGKAGKAKQRQRAGNPLGLDSGVGGPSAAPEAAPPPLLANLTSLDSSSRAWAAASISHLVGEPAVRATLLQGNAVGKLIMLLSDAPEVAVEAAGALHNIVLTDVEDFGGGQKRAEQEKKETAVEEMFRKDAMTPLLALVPRAIAFLQACGHLTKPEHAEGDDDAQMEGKAELANGDSPLGPKLSRKQKKALKGAAANGAPATGQSNTAKKEKDDAKVFLDLLEQILSLLWIMSERHSRAHELASASELPQLLASLLPLAPSLPASLVVVAGQLLNVLVEDNEDVHRRFAENGQWARSLVDLLRSTLRDNDAGARYPGYSLVQLRTLSLLLSAILHGLSGIPGDSIPIAEAAELVLSAVAAAIQHDLAAAFRKAGEQGRSKSDETGGDGETFRSVTKSTHGVAAEWDAVKLALEVLSNVCSDPNEAAPPEGDESDAERKDDAGWEDVEMDQDEEGPAQGAAGDGADDEADDDFPDDEDMDEVLGDAGTAAKVSSEGLGSRLEELGILRSVQQLASPLDLSSVDDSQDEIVEAALEVQQRALGALNNALTIMPRSWYAKHSANLGQLWTWTFEVLASAHAASLRFPALSQTVAELAGAVVGVQLALARGFAPGNAALVAEFDLPLPTTPDQIAQLTSLKDLRLTGTLVPLLSLLAQRRPGHVESNRTISRFLLALATETATDLEITAEALDAIFDIFADGAWDYDAVWKEEGMLAALRNSYAWIKAKVKSVDKRKEREVRERADLAVQNLHAFLKYKEAEAKRSR